MPTKLRYIHAVDSSQTIGNDAGAHAAGDLDKRAYDVGDLVGCALAAGASAAALLAPDQVITAEWVRWKCLYGCSTAGHCLTCPPLTPTLAETRRLLAEYRRVLLLRFDIDPQAGDRHAVRRRVLAAALELERRLFLAAGLHRALAIAGGRGCDRDELCVDPRRCDSRASLRPGPAGLGIDVFATAAQAGWHISVVPESGAAYHRLALVLVD